MATYDSVVLYIILGGLIGVVWALRRIYILENKIDQILEHAKKGKK